ncbi:hypothetical protein [Massilia sp. Root418]|uniref:hypothetical protein n=1 Tax=Massilia sp. Root418 TaxID=1736532 RepID=UPI000A72A428|nr:hypothetical protein [Massilia sp. Root418]
MNKAASNAAAPKLPPGSVASSKPEGHQDAALDEGLDETFPASDPVAISIPKPSSSPL